MLDDDVGIAFGKRTSGLGDLAGEFGDGPDPLSAGDLCALT